MAAPPPRDTTLDSANRPIAPANPNAPPVAAPTPVTNDLLPSADEISAVGSEIHANKIATPSMVRTILQSAAAAYPGATVADLFELAWACYHNGSSALTTLLGSTSHGIPLASLKDIVEGVCTLRQFCMFYAKTCYNKGKEERIAPATWAAKGYKEENKFASFDFFTGVLSDASPKPPGGMKHWPTPSEIAAGAVNATMAILESRGQSNQFSNRGNMLAMQQVRAPTPPPMITFG